MRRFGEFEVSATALQEDGGQAYRPALMIRKPMDTLSEHFTITGLVEIGDADQGMSEEAAHHAAESALQEVVRVAEHGRALFSADGPIQVRVIFPRP